MGRALRLIVICCVLESRAWLLGWVLWQNFCIRMQSLSSITPFFKFTQCHGMNRSCTNIYWLALSSPNHSDDFLWLSKVAPGLAIVDYLQSVTLAHHSKPLQFFSLVVCFQAPNNCDLMYSWPPDVVPILKHRSHCRFSLLCYGHHLLENLRIVIEELNIDLSGLHGSITGLIPLFKIWPLFFDIFGFDPKLPNMQVLFFKSFPRYCCTELY